MVKDRNLHTAISSRNLDNYFSKVISVHPLVGILSESPEKYGLPDIINISDDHIFIEGTRGLTKWLKWIFPLNFILGQLALFRMLKSISIKENISVIRIGDPYYLGVMGLTLKFFLKIPIVIRVCGNYDDISKKTGRAIMPRIFRYRWVEKIVERYVFKRCDLIAGANENNMNYGINNGAPKEKSTIFRYGNLLDPLHWTDPGKRSDASMELQSLGLLNKKFILTVARLEAEKYVDHFIYTIEELRKRNHNVYGLIIGDGGSRSHFEDLSDTKNLSKYIKFAGNRNQQWIANILPHASLILSPHMGRALTEAALSNVPIVGYDHDWQKEVLINNKTGYLVEHENWLEMSNKSEEALCDKDKSLELARNAREHIFNIMSPDLLNAHEKKSYDTLINDF